MTVPKRCVIYLAKSVTLQERREKTCRKRRKATLRNCLNKRRTLKRKEKKLYNVRQRGESLHKTASLRQGEETVKCEETLQEPCCVGLYLLGACICVIVYHCTESHSGNCTADDPRGDVRERGDEQKWPLTCRGW